MNKTTKSDTFPAGFSGLTLNVNPNSTVSQGNLPCLSTSTPNVSRSSSGYFSSANTPSPLQTESQRTHLSVLDESKDNLEDLATSLTNLQIENQQVVQLSTKNVLFHRKSFAM